MENQELNKDSATTIKLNIDNIFLQKKHNFFSIAVLIVLTGIFLLASFTPSSIIARSRPPAACIASVYDTIGYQCAPFSLANNPVYAVEVSELKAFNKFLALDMTPLDIISNNKVTIQAKVEVSGFIIKDNELQNTLFTKQEQDLKFECSGSQLKACDTDSVLSIQIPDERDFYFVIKVVNADELKTQMNGMDIISATYNSSFRTYLFAVKMVLCAITLGCIMWNSIKLGDLRKEYHTKEQSALQFMSPLLIIMNEPITIYVFEGKVYLWLTTSCFLLLSALLMHFWLSNIDKLAASDSSFIERTSKFAKIYTACYLVITVLVYISLVNFTSINNYFDYNSTKSILFRVSQGLLFATVGVGIVWILYKSRSVYLHLDEANERENSFVFFSYIFLFGQFYIVVRGSLYPFSYDGTALVLFCGMTTLYVFVSNFLYLPTREGIEAANYLRKYENKEVKANYDDLEKSVVRPQPNNNNNVNFEPYGISSKQCLDSEGDHKPEQVVVVGVVGNELEHPVVEQSYPFDHKGDGDM